MGSGGGGGFGLEFLSGVVGDQGVDGGLELAFHHRGELVVGEADAVVGHAILGKVVSTDFLRAVARADLLLAVLGLELVDALGLDFI